MPMIEELVTTDAEKKCASKWLDFCEQYDNPKALETFCKYLIKQREIDLENVRKACSAEDEENYNDLLDYLCKNKSEKIEDRFGKDSITFQEGNIPPSIARKESAEDEDEDDEEGSTAKRLKLVKQMSQSEKDKLLLHKRTEEADIKDLKIRVDMKMKKIVCEMIFTIESEEIVYVLLDKARKYARRRLDLIERRDNRNNSRNREAESKAIGSLVEKALKNRKRVHIRKCPSISSLSSSSSSSSSLSSSSSSNVDKGSLFSKGDRKKFWKLLSDLQGKNLLNLADLVEITDGEFDKRMLECSHMTLCVFRELRSLRDKSHPIKNIPIKCNKTAKDAIVRALISQGIETEKDLFSLSENAFETVVTRIPGLFISSVDEWKRRRRERKVTEVNIAELEMKRLDARSVGHFESVSNIDNETDRDLTQLDFFTLHGDAFRKSYLVSNFSSSRYDQLQRSYDRTQTVDRIMEKAQELVGWTKNDRTRHRDTVEKLVGNLKKRGICSADHFYSIQDETFERVFGELCEDTILFEMLWNMRKDRKKKRKLLQSRFVEQRKSVYTSLRILSITDVDTSAMSFRASILVFLVWNDEAALEALKKHRIGLGDDEAKLLRGHQLSHEEWTEHVKFHPQVGFANLKETEEVFDDDWNQKSDPPKIKLVPKIYYRHVLPKNEYDSFADLIFLQVQTVNACFNESFELDKFPFDTQRLHFILRPREDYRKIILRQFRGPFDDGQKGPNNDAANYSDGAGCNGVLDKQKIQFCCMCTPATKEKVRVAVRSKHARSGLEIVDGTIEDIVDDRFRVKITNSSWTRSRFSCAGRSDIVEVPLGRIYRAKLCACSRRGIKRAFRNHISRWAAKAVPEFDFHYATVQTYMDATSLTNTYSVFEFAIHIERKAGYYFFSYYVTLVSCIIFTLMLFSTDPLVTDRFENLVALVLTCTALKFTLAEHVPAEGGTTMLDKMIVFCIVLITLCGLECWALDTFSVAWSLDDEVDRVNMWFGAGTTFIVFLFFIHHISEYMIIRGKNYLEMLRVDVEWLSSGGDDSFGLYETPEKESEVSMDRLVVSPKANKLAEYAHLFRHKHWQLDASTIYAWLDSLRNNELAGDELFDFVGVHEIVIGKALAEPEKLKKILAGESFVATNDKPYLAIFTAMVAVETLKMFFEMCSSLLTKCDESTFTAELVDFFAQENAFFRGKNDERYKKAMAPLKAMAEKFRKDTRMKKRMWDDQIKKIARGVRKNFREAFVEHFPLVYSSQGELSQAAIDKINRRNKVVNTLVGNHKGDRKEARGSQDSETSPLGVAQHLGGSSKVIEMAAVVKPKEGRERSNSLDDTASKSLDDTAPPLPPVMLKKNVTEFISLYVDWNRLSSEYPGYLIPPLPEKRQMGRFDPSFIEVRRRYLQKFLRRIARHPALKKSQDFRDFISASEHELAAVKSSKAKSVTSSLLSWFSAPVKVVSQTLGSVSLPKTAADTVFDDHCNYVESLLRQLERVHKHLRGLLKYQNDYAESMFQFGLAFTLLGQSEADKLGGSLSQLGHTADRLSQVHKTHVFAETSVFADPLKDYIGMTRAAQAMLETRREKYAAYQSCVAEHRRAESSLADLKTQGRVNMSKIHAAENAVAQSKAKMETSKDTLKAIDERIGAEMEHFKSQKLVDFRKIVLGYVQQQVDYQRQAEEIWGKLIPELEKLEKEEEEEATAASGAAGYET
eukprot:g3694.t1